MLALPIDPVLSEITSRLAKERRLVLVAPPGSGKTTRVPRALLDADIAGEIVVLEPRRLAARMAAKRVADELGEPLGKRVGYTVRFDDVSSKETRIRFVTEGVLARRILSDPTLRGVGAVLLDEFHERHLQSDTVLALLRESAPDIMLLVMSATLEAEEIARGLDCAVIQAEGRPFPVAVSFDDAKDGRALALRITSGVRRALDETTGHVLVFLPGAGEIRAAASAAENLIREKGAISCILHGDMPPAEQDVAVAPSKTRKVIFSTNVAESSVTIDGVTAVVDSGVARVSVFDPWTGFARLETASICQASAVQRAGRAGRTGPGIALRLYSKVDFERRPIHQPPEIETADLSSLWLELLAHGRRNVPWLTPPPAPAVKAAEDLLLRLSAIDERGAATELGRAMARYPLHPRQSRLLLEASRAGLPGEGRILAALLTERDLRREARTFQSGAQGAGASRSSGDSDLLELLSLFEELRDQRFSREAAGRLGLDANVASRVDRVEKQLRREGERASRWDAAPSPLQGDQALLRAILVAFPDRVAKRKAAGSREIAIAGAGRGELSPNSCVHHAPYIVTVDVENVRGVPTARLASRIEPEWLLDLFPERVKSIEEPRWNEEKACAERVSQLTYETIVIDESTGGAPSEAEAALLFSKAKARGFTHFSDGPAIEAWLARVRFAAAQDARVPPLTDERIDSIFREACEGLRSFRELDAAGLGPLLIAATDGAALVESLAPTHFRFPNGRTAPIDYTVASGAVLGSYLQDFFGVKDIPRAGRQPLVLHLWAPNKRAVQITQDLPSFWKNHYQTIRKELSRKYPRHVWPDDPTIPQKPLKSQNR